MTGGRLSGRRILLVEDEAVIAMLLEDMLIALGCEVVGVAARLDEALCLIRSESFDAAVLDVNLGGQPSYPAADALVALGVPFAFSTGYDRVKNGYTGLPRLQKPYDIDRLEDLITKILEISQCKTR